MRRLIGVVGHPTHGKSTALRWLQDITGGVIFDTGAPLRRACMERYGLSWDDVSTQAGKLRTVHRPELGDAVTVRQALGDYGKLREAESADKNIWTTIAVDEALETLFPTLLFDSVRMGQGEVIVENGGIVIEIVDPRKPKSHHDFDQYDPRFVTEQVWNDGDLGTFRRRLAYACGWYIQDEQFDEIYPGLAQLCRPPAALAA